MMRLNSRGFTLLEIMIAITILAGLSILTSEAIRNGLTSREKYSREIKETSQVRDVLRVMERDINMAFHHRDIFTTMMNEIQKERSTPPPQGQPPQEGVSNQKPIPKNLTAFVGDSESLNFTTLSNIRMMKDVPESEQAEVGYYVRPCKGRKAKGGRLQITSSNCLVRRLSPNVDEDVTKGGNEIVILEHVQEFKLRYFGPDREDWVEQWKTGKNGDAISKENFPYAVEISLSAKDDQDPKSKTVSMLMVAPIRFPNNPPKKKDEQPGAVGQ